LTPSHRFFLPFPSKYQQYLVRCSTKRGARDNTTKGALSLTAFALAGHELVMNTLEKSLASAINKV